MICGDTGHQEGIRMIMPAKVPISSTKSMHGHTMGAAGAIEFIVSLLAIKNQAVPPTINLDQPDPECDLDYVPNIGRKGVMVNTVMSNAFAFGGSQCRARCREDGGNFRSGSFENPAADIRDVGGRRAVLKQASAGAFRPC
jgi:3-oxoacyl-(acyl-carrier-protein) synthase